MARRGEPDRRKRDRQDKLSPGGMHPCQKGSPGARECSNCGGHGKVTRPKPGKCIACEGHGYVTLL